MKQGDSRLYRNGRLAKAKVFYEMRPNSTYSPSRFKTYEEALEYLNNFNNQEPDSEYFDYWEDQKNQCVIVRVQQVEDVVRTSEDSRYEEFGNVSTVKQRLLDVKKARQALQA
jgi:viroplasmin and RNaseH domain-containing protein